MTMLNAVFVHRELAPITHIAFAVQILNKSVPTFHEQANPLVYNIMF